MSLSALVSATPTAIMHRLSAGSKFNGEIPDGGTLIANSINKYDAGPKGGLFYFENTRTISIHHYTFDFGQSVDYTVNVVSLNPDRTVADRMCLEEGTGRVLTGPTHFGFVIGQRQALEVIVTSALPANPEPMIGTVWAIDATAFFIGR